ncbi:MAG: helix-turn-helix transcriptional regulator [Polyangiaceae bacterium]
MPRYAPAARLDRLRTLLRAGRSTLPALAEKLDVSLSTVRRLLEALESAGDSLVEETRDDGRKTWTLARDSRPPRSHDVRLTTAQLIALLIARNGARELLRGTGFDDDLDAACTALTDTLREKDAALAKDLDRKLYDRGEMPLDHAPHADALDEMTSALLKNERLELRRRASDGEERTHKFDPYSLVTSRKGFYLTGFSHDRAQRISLGIDAILEATRCRGDTFDYPADYQPADMFKGSIGMFVGPMTHVCVRFDGDAKRFVLRRRIHESQRVVAEHGDGAVDVAMHIAGTTELESFVLSFGDKAEILSPPALRRKVGDVLRRAAKRYEDKAPGA